MLVLFSAVVSAQSFQGSLRGRITDPKDAIVPIAKVTVIDEATSVSSATITNQQGEYSFPALKPSTYTLVVEAPGFKRLEKKTIVISTQSAVAQDGRLELGAVTETINVSAEADLLVTAEASTGTVIDRQKLEDLPLLGRDPFLLARLSEGVVWTGNPKFDRMEDQSGQSQISIAGGPVAGNNYTLDGISITDSTNRAVIIPVQDAVSEMKVQANTYDAAMGRTGGGVFNATMRSGTNRMHGSAFGLLRETDWLANNYFANKNGQAKPDSPFKNYGDSLGGPIRIPKIYDGRNRTFFYVSTEGYRQFDAVTSTTNVPTALERVGDFSKSGSTLKNGTLQAIYDPLSTNLATGERTPFGGNVIPASRLDPIGLKLASYFPLPTTAPTFYGAPDYAVTLRTQDRADQGTFKVDHELFSWLKLSANYLHYGSQEPSNQTWPGSIATPGQTTIYRHVDAFGANATATLNPTTVLTVRFGYNRFPDYDPQFSRGFQLTELGFPAAVDALTRGPSNFPNVSTGEFTTFGGGNTSWRVQFSTSFNAELAKFVGKHGLKFGYEWRALHDATTTSTAPSSFSFDSSYTSQTPAKTVTGTGGGLATMLLGYPGGSITQGSFFNDYVRYNAFFIQDDYRITPKLTVNLGFRGEHETNPAEVNNKYLIDADLTLVNPLQASIPSLKLMGQARYAGVNGNPNHAGNPLGLKAGPRIGFAYSANSSTVIRGGWGIFWIPQSFSAQNATGYSQSTSIVTSTNNKYTPISSLQNPYPNGLTPIAGNSLGGLAAIGQAITATDPGTRSAGYVEQMSLDVQRQVMKNLALKLGYVGSHTLHTPYSIPLNNLDPAVAFALGSAGLSKVVANPFYGSAPPTTNLGNSTTLAQYNLLSAYPAYSGVSLNTPMGRAFYYSLYFKGDWRMRYGLTLGATYTWSRNMALSSVQNYYAPIVPQGLALASTDTPNSYSMSFTWQVPVGHGKTFLRNSNKLVDIVAGGWSVQGTQLIHTGTPLSVSQTNGNTGCGCGQNPTATGVSAVRPDSVTDPTYEWLNPAAFSITPAYSFGNVAPRLNVYGPGLFDLDVSAFKTFTVKENYKFQFRAEALNVTNTVLFAAPATDITKPGTFGTITSQANFPRLIQMGVRITF
ncbi:MAG TPA: carboxypeptidase-like regulatory domain-containing protein [Bryobacteraceae bacterium]|jgi:hypothetical protein